MTDDERSDRLAKLESKVSELEQELKQTRWGFSINTPSSTTDKRAEETYDETRNEWIAYERQFFSSQQEKSDWMASLEEQLKHIGSEPVPPEGVLRVFRIHFGSSEVLLIYNGPRFLLVLPGETTSRSLHEIKAMLDKGELLQAAYYTRLVSIISGWVNNP